MSREDFYDYVLENFNTSGEFERLLDNILKFIEKVYADKNKRNEALREILGGVIGLSYAEIRQVWMDVQQGRNEDE